MATVTQTTFTQLTDSRARVSLPEQFANTTVIIEQVSDSELRIRKANVAPEEEQVTFVEEEPRTMSYRDQLQFFELLENPPPPNEALKKAAQEYEEHRTRSRTQS